MLLISFKTSQSIDFPPFFFMINSQQRSLRSVHIEQILAECIARKNMYSIFSARLNALIVQVLAEGPAVVLKFENFPTISSFEILEPCFQITQFQFTFYIWIY